MKTASATPHLAPGQRVGPYEIVSVAGVGGMGQVYRAKDTRLDRTVAIKVLSLQLESSTSTRERFLREARAVSRLNHPHICTLHDIGCHEGIRHWKVFGGRVVLLRIPKNPDSDQRPAK